MDLDARSRISVVVGQELLKCPGCFPRDSSSAERKRGTR